MRERRDLRLLTSHGAILLLLAHQPDRTISALARDTGLTERQVSRVLRDLLDAGYVRVERQGTGRHYQVVPDRPISARPAFSGVSVRDLMPIAYSLLGETDPPHPEP